MDLPTSVAISVGIITTGGIILKFFGRNSKDKDCISSDQCSENREAIKEDLEKGETAFEEIRKDLKKQAIMLGRIDERTLLWARKNGIVEK